MFASEELEQKLAELITKNDVPGAQLAVLDGDAVTEVAAGVLSLRTGQATTPDALFLPGSIGKLYTATLVMMLVEEGTLDLDTPIRTYLPDFEVADPRARDTVTARDLLTHTSGFDGDHFTDTGRGDDALAAYVAGCAELPQIAPPGAIWSYSNSGYSILGRIVEVQMGMSFEQALRERIFTPLGLQHTVSFAEDAIVHPAAVGHIPDPEDPATQIVSTTWGLWRAFGPMGSAVVASAGDVLEFVRLHLDGGMAPDGTRLLDAGLAASMLEQQVELVDDSVLGKGWGLGWILDRWGDVTVIGHDGGTIGQSAFLRVVPEAGLVVALLTNGGDVMGLFGDVVKTIVKDVAGVELPGFPTVPTEEVAVDAAPLVGFYSNSTFDMTVSVDDDGRIWLDSIPKGIAAEMGEEAEHVQLVGLDADSLIAVEPTMKEMHVVYAFLGEDGDGRRTHMHYGRAISRAD